MMECYAVNKLAIKKVLNTPHSTKKKKRSIVYSGEDFEADGYAEFISDKEWRENQMYEYVCQVLNALRKPFSIL